MAIEAEGHALIVCSSGVSESIAAVTSGAASLRSSTFSADRREACTKGVTSAAVVTPSSWSCGARSAANSSGGSSRRCWPLTQRNLIMSTAGDLVTRSSEKASVSSPTE